MYSPHLLDSDSALSTGKHTQITKENSKGMKDLTDAPVDSQGGYGIFGKKNFRPPKLRSLYVSLLRWA